MKTAEILLRFMDRIQALVETINGYIERGLEFFRETKAWIQKIIDYLETAIDALVESMGGRPSTMGHMQEEYMFV